MLGGESRVLDVIATTIEDVSQFMPGSDRVVLRPENIANKVESSIYIPEAVREDIIDRGVVVAIGSGYVDDKTLQLRPMQVKPGDKVLLHSKYAATELEIGGERFLIVAERDIVAIVEEV